MLTLFSAMAWSHEKSWSTFRKAIMQLRIFQNYTANAVIASRTNQFRQYGSLHTIIDISGASTFDSELYQATVRLSGPIPSVNNEFCRDTQSIGLNLWQNIRNIDKPEVQIVTAIWTYLWKHRSVMFRCLDDPSISRILTREPPSSEIETMSKDVSSVCSKLIDGVLIGPNCINIVKVMYAFFVRQIICSCPIRTSFIAEQRLHTELWSNLQEDILEWLSGTFATDRMKEMIKYCPMLIPDILDLIESYVDDRNVDVALWIDHSIDNVFQHNETTTVA